MSIGTRTKAAIKSTGILGLKSAAVAGLILSAGSAMAQLKDDEVSTFIYMNGLSSNSHSKEAKQAGIKQTVDTTSLNSFSPGDLRFGFFTKKWGVLAEIMPSAGNVGSVGAGYAVVPGNYVGIHMGSNSTEVKTKVGGTSTTVETGTTYYGLGGYGLMPITKDQLVTYFLTYSMLSGKDSAVSEVDGSVTKADVDGSVLDLVVRYAFRLTKNFSYSPGIQYTSTSYTVGSGAAKLDISETNFRLIPVGFIIQL